MTRRYSALLPAAVLILLSPASRGDVIVSTSLSLTQLQITSDGGTTPDILSGFNNGVFNSVYDSLGGADANYDFEVDTPASASSATTLANASGTANAPDFSANASSGVDIAGIAAEAGTNDSGPYAELAGFFQIDDSTTNTDNPDQNPVNVTLTTLLDAEQSLYTDANGLDAKSEIIFNLFLYDPLGNLVTSEFLDNPLEIGPNTTLNASSTPTYSTGSLALMTNSAYYLDVSVDAESYGLNASVPEPSYGGLAALVSLSIAFLVRRKTVRV